MKFERITDFTDKNFISAFNLYTRSFPTYEQRTINDQKLALNESEYNYNIILVEEQFSGIMLYWENEEFIYIEHFAIRNDLRGKSYGTQALNFLKQKGKKIILEIDPPIDEISIKRKNFYEKNGFLMNPFYHIHPPYRLGIDGHNLTVVSYPETICPIIYDKFVTYLKDKIMNYSEYNQR